MESLAAAQQFIDGAPDGILVVDADGRIIMLNARLADMLGFDAADLLGELIEKLVPTDLETVHRSHRAGYVEAPTQRQLGDEDSQLTARKSDGTLLPVEIALSPIELDDGEATMAIVRDSTRRFEWQVEREAVEREVKTSEARFRSAFGDAAVPMVIVDLAEPSHRRILLANDAMADLLGTNIDDLPGSNLTAITHPDDRRKFELAAAAMMRGASTYHAEQRLQRADGSSVWTQIDVSTIDGLDGSPQALAHFIDISRRVDAERERDRREQLLSELASVRKLALDEAPVDDILQLVADATLMAADVDHCFIASPDASGDLVCRTVASVQAPDCLGGVVVPDGEVAAAHRAAEPVSLLNPASDTSIFADGPPLPVFGPLRISPMRKSSTNAGVLVAVRASGSEPFNKAEESRIDSLATEAAVALLLAQARHDHRQMLLVEDRERIARDLHDVVIQRLFATGMSLQSSLGTKLMGERIEQAITDLDEVIAVIRSTIFRLTRTSDSLNAEIKRLVNRQRDLGHSSIALTINGPLEAVPALVRDDLTPMLLELLSNVERHSHADHVSVDLLVTDEAIRVVVSDDGAGFEPGSDVGFGLRNITERAARLGGTLHVTSPTDPTSATGSSVEWQIPLGTVNAV